MAHRIRIRDIKGGSRHGKGMRRPLRTAIAVIVATAMLTPTIASAAPVVPDAPSPVPGVESSSPYADDGGTYTADGRPLYESASDTIYIYNALQTAVSRQEDAADQPVLTGDGDAETFGTGQPIYVEGSDEPLTYSPEHTYVYVDGWDEGLEDAGENNNVELQTGEGEGDEPEAQEETVAEKNDEGEKNEQVEKNDEAEKNDDSATDSTTTGESGPSDTDESTAAQDAATIAGAEVLSDGEDGTTGKVLLADESAVGELDGRDYVGQTVKNINGTDYILIGNEQQLRAIGSNKHVTDKVWYRLNNWDEWDLKYGGDADLASGEELADDEYVNKHYGDVLDRDWAGTNEDGTPARHNPDTGLTYSSSANYIIFRDIKLTSDWTPLMFTGTMFGSKSATGTNAGSLWSCFETEGTNSGISDISITDGADSRPKISNVTIDQSDAISTDKQSGVGFFASLYSESEISKNSLGKSQGKVRVNGIILDGVRVTTSTTETVDTETLVSIVADILGGLLGLVGGVFDILLGWLPGFKDLSLGDALRNLFNLHNSDPSVFATGAFAGRIVGDVEVEHCTAVDVLVSNANSMTGGFVGYIEGQPQYSILDGISGTLINTLTAILNAIPGLGLGDLITLLLNNKILDLDSLIPIGYYRPVISDCDVDTFVAAAEGGTPTIGLETTSFAGGFAGVQIGAIIESSRVESEGALQINAKEYAGGFVGLMRDGEVQGLLENLGVKLVDLTRPQSLAYESTVHVATLSVAAEDKHAGGFTGATAASHLVNSSVQAKRSLNVKAPLYAGGLVGEATMGWITNLGADEGDENLLESLAGIVTGLVGQDNSGQLLALMGFDPSTILGGSVIGGSVTVASTSDYAGGKVGYAGGMVGMGEGVTIASSTADQVQKLAFWQTGERYAGTTPVTRGNLVLGLSQVQSGGSYAGGIAGAMETASVGGLLNGVLGIGSLKDLAGGGFTAFEVSDTRVNDASAIQELVDGKASWIDSTIAPNGAYTVTAEGYSVGGAIGCATGGTVDNVSVHGLSSVKAVGEVGGFIGQAAAGDVLGSDGVNLLRLVRLSGLLSVAQSTRLTVDDSTVTGIDDAGFTVTAKEGDSSATTQHTAGGFYGRASSMTTTDSHVANLKSVTAPNTNGMAGGFVGLSTTGGLAQVLSDEDESSGVRDDLIGNGLLNINGLAGAVPYMIPKYKVTDVTYVDGGEVTADIAGGYAGSFESGEVNKFDESEGELAKTAQGSPWAVKNISKVNGKHYAGGFGGKVESGSLAEAGGGIDLLDGLTEVKVTDLANLVSAYVPDINYAGVSSGADPAVATAATTDGFTVAADAPGEGRAGGFIGYGSGVQVSNSDVKYLRHTTVTEPDELEGQDGSEYFDGSSLYAVTGTLYAGGYIGDMNIGSAASVGDGLSLLKGTDVEFNLNSILSVANNIASTIKDSDVEGQAGGYAVRASNGKGSNVGDAGGFAGIIRGGQIENSDAHNFSHIIGQVSAGGYAGQAVPGDVADILGDGTSILDGLVSTKDSLASLLQHFVPEILNSETTSIPCGGAVRAQAESDAKTLRGLAGGYIGHNVGAQIKGNVTGDGHSPKEAAAIRIRSVYGAEYAGGFTGLMEAGSTASTGSLGLLWDLVNVDNLLNALDVAYPTEEGTAVYGPLAKLDVNTWNAWVDAVGVNGGYGSELADGKVSDQTELDEKLADFAYGMNVVAGREDVAGTGAANAMPGGAAGGYVGAMVTGTITNGHAHDVKLVRGMRAAGGFAGMAEAGGAAQLGSVDILGLGLDLGSLLDVANVFVPVIKSSTTTGYRTGMTVESSGTGARQDDITNSTGNAGGYIGYGAGVQIWGDGSEDAPTCCSVSNLRRVRGAAYAGGYAGRLLAGSVARVDTDGASSGFLQAVIESMLNTAGVGDLAQVLQATMSTVSGASVKPADEAWGFTVEGPASGDVKHPIAAGGFAGAIEATVLGKRNLDSTSTSAVTVTGLRGVDGGLYAGGFVGVATAGGVAQVSAGTGEGASTTILGGLLKLGNIDAIQAFQPFIYGGSVTGVADGLQVRANEWDKGGLMHSQRMSGNAGGFAGTVMSGEVLNSKVANLNSVTGINYAGGFVGYTGKSGIADVEDLEALKLIGLTASIGDLIGTTVTNCSVAGIPAGYTVASQGPAGKNSVNGDEPDAAEGGQKAGGFIGYADLARITRGTATNLKRVGSAEAAGGFAGETSHAYLVSAAADSAVLGALNQVVNGLVKALYLDKAQRENVIEVNLGGDLLKLEIFSDDDVLSVTLLGLKISASLSKGTGDGGTDVVNVTIGDSTFTLPCNDQGLTEDADLEVNLIKGNSAQITESKVTGIADGYDVFGGGATQDKNGEDGNGYGYAGGFVGHNDEGVLTGDEMVYADVVRGTAGKTGPFTGVTDYRSNWWFNSVDDIEHDNKYHVYRGVDLADAPVSGAQNMTVSPGAYDSGVPGSDDPATAGNAAWARFDVTGHKPKAGKSNLDDWKDAQATPTKTEDEPDAGGETAEPQAPQPVDLGVYMEEGAKAVLMADAAVTDNTGGLTPEPGDGQDPCAQKVDVTVQKVWNDGHAADRPTKITVMLKATYTDGSGTTHTPDTIQSVDADGNPLGAQIKNPIAVTLSSADQSAWSDTWRKVVENLPVAIKDDSGVHYLTYTPTEVTVSKGGNAVKLGESGYTVSYTVDAHDRVITITNSTPLPETGGMGAHWFAILGILLVGVGILLTRKDTYGRGTGRHRAAR